jgi:hypothetical protein
MAVQGNDLSRSFQPPRNLPAGVWLALTGSGLLFRNPETTANLAEGLRAFVLTSPAGVWLAMTGSGRLWLFFIIKPRVPALQASRS